MGDFGSLHGGLREEGIIFRLRVLELRALPLMDPLIYGLVPVALPSLHTWGSVKLRSEGLH